MIQSAPKKVRQTEKTKLKSLEFGLASKQAAYLRVFFKGCLPYTDGNVSGRFTAAIARCIKTSELPVGERHLHNADLSTLNYFSFNAEADIQRVLDTKPIFNVSADGAMSFSLPLSKPSLNLRFPPDADHSARIGVHITAVSLLEPYCQVIDEVRFDVGRTAAPHQLEWTCKRSLPRGSMIFALFTLQFLADSWKTKDIRTSRHEALPSLILEAFHVSDNLSEASHSAGFPEPITEGAPLPFFLEEDLMTIRKFLDSSSG